MRSVLFVCVGNICRSPAAEGLLRHLAEGRGKGNQLHVESCGIGDWHIGSLPDPRMREVAQVRGVTLTSRAQEFRRRAFSEFDLIFAVDQLVLNHLYSLARTPEEKAKLHLISQFSGRYQGKNIPDPYCSGVDGFERVFDMLQECCQGIVDHLFKE